MSVSHRITHDQIDSARRVHVARAQGTPALAIAGVLASFALASLCPSQPPASMPVWPRFGREPNCELRSGLALHPGLFAIGDLDRNGRPDVVCANWSAIFMMFNMGGASWIGRMLPYDYLAGFANGLALADIDGDGDLDLAMARWGATAVPPGLFLNDGTGQFALAPPGTFPPGLAMLGHSVVFGDIDRDGDLDLLFGTADRGVVALRNDGLGHFADVSSTAVVYLSYTIWAMRLVDLDHDGWVDLVVAGGGASGAMPSNVVLNDAQGRLSIITYTGLPNPTSGIAIADVNGDTHPDIVFGNVSTQDRLLLNNGQGSFQDATNQLPPEADWTYCVALADIDGDGYPDLLAGTAAPQNRHPLRIYRNDGTGQFSDTSGWGLYEGINGSGLDMAVADLDGDGESDIVLNGHPTFANLNHTRFHLNRRRHVFTTAWPQVGGVFTLTCDADVGSLVFPALSLGARLTQIPSLGELALDPATTIFLPVLTMPLSRQGTRSIAVPNNPALRGQLLCSQALVLEPGASAKPRLTNWRVDWLQ